VHVELNCFGLLLVLEMIISQKVVDFIDDRRCRDTAHRKAWSLKEIKIKHAFNSLASHIDKPANEGKSDRDVVFKKDCMLMKSMFLI